MVRMRRALSSASVAFTLASLVNATPIMGRQLATDVHNSPPSPKRIRFREKHLLAELASFLLKRTADGKHTVYVVETQTSISTTFAETCTNR